jgi:glycosyltransferase involved in cell wall biosynthesis
MRNMKKLIIIPAYNESANIENTVKDIVNNAPDFDYVIINDCSTDNTFEICERNGFNVVNLPLNLGIGGAVQTGYLYAYNNGYDIAVQVDGDGQHDPAFLTKMAEVMVAEKADMLIGSRFLEKEGFQSSRVRRMGITYFTWLIKLFTRKKITDPTSGLRMINSDIIEIFAESYPRDYPEPESVVHVIRLGKNVREIPVIMRERQGGKSSIRFFSSIYYMIKVTVAILTELMRKIDRKKEAAK